VTEAPGRPAEGLGHYLRDVVNGALDGVITTLAVISGASGAHLEPRIGLILGMANLVGDGISMGASNYLGLKSELQQTGGSAAIEMPWRHGLATVVAFALFGAVPLVAYAVPRPDGMNIFPVAITLALAALAVLGGLRARYVAKRSSRSAAEVIAIGFAASGAAYVIGGAAERFTR
jgi:VIT1/CCC1 family predicted Fe2+/Mn2+ transporter